MVQAILPRRRGELASFEVHCIVVSTSSWPLVGAKKMAIWAFVLQWLDDIEALARLSLQRLRC